MSLLIVTSCTKEIDYWSLVERQGLVFEVNSTKGFSGIAIRTDNKGNVRRKTKYKDGYQHGLEETFSVKDGLIILSNQTNFKNGDMHGLSLDYHSNGQLYLTGNYANNHRSGEWKSYHSNGQLKSIWNYTASGKITGTVIGYHRGGTLASKASYQNGIRVGVYETYYISGQLSESRRYTANPVLGKLGKFELSSALDEYSCEFDFIVELQTPSKKAIAAYARRAGLLDGLFEAFYENKKRKVVGNYHSGLAHGVWEYYDENGQLKRKGHCEMGAKVGLYEVYYSDGTLQSKINYVQPDNDRFGGRAVFSIGSGSIYYPSGKLHFSSDQIGVLGFETIYGPGTRYLENGKIKSKSTCDINFCQAETFSYFDDGTLEWRHTYKLNKLDHTLQKSAEVIPKKYRDDKWIGDFFFTSNLTDMPKLWKLDGPAIYYYLDGLKYTEESNWDFTSMEPQEPIYGKTHRQIRMKGIYREGKKHGEWELYRKNGKLRRLEYNMGRKL